MKVPASVLVVDDEPYVCEVLSRWLVDEGYDCETVFDAEQALAALEQNRYELVLLDVNLPGMSGVDLLARIRDDFADVFVVMVTGNADRETADCCLQLGAHAYVLKPFDQREVLFNVAACLESKRIHQQLEDKVRRRTEELRRREEEIALRLVAAAEYRDEESVGHIRRIGMFAEALARALGRDLELVDDIRIAATMHDIGKIGVPDGILLKPGDLTAEEFEVVKLHTKIGARMLAGSDVSLIQMAEGVARSHHERWDGSGYPAGLRGEAIPEPARIVAIADVYDALRHARVDRPPFSEKEALAIMAEGRGTHFDPTIFDVFLEVLPAFRRIRETVAEDAEDSAAGALDSLPGITRARAAAGSAAP